MEWWSELGTTQQVLWAAIGTFSSVLLILQLGLSFLGLEHQSLTLGHDAPDGHTDTTDSHHLVIAALNDSYAIFAPGELMSSGDIAALATRAFAAAFKIGMQLSAPFLVFGLVFNIGLGVLARLMPQMQVYFVGVPLSILAGFLIFALVIAAMMGTFLDYFIGVMHDLIPVK